MYYFGGSDDGSMKTGSQTVKDDNGDSFKFYFGTKDNSNTGEVKGKGCLLYTSPFTWERVLW